MRNSNNKRNVRRGKADVMSDRTHGGTQVSQKLAARVQKIALESLSPSQRGTSTLYMDPWSVPKGTLLGPSFERWVVEQDSVLCFADHVPDANFAHNCSYYLHDARNGEQLRRVRAEFPPYPGESIHLMRLFHDPVGLTRTFPLPFGRENGTGAPVETVMRAATGQAGRRFAILFTGESETRHVNDLEFCLRTLLHPKIGFASEDIFVLCHDGTGNGAPFLDAASNPRTWPGDNTAFKLKQMPLRKGSRKAFKAVVSNLTLGPNDLLFIHTEGHGGTNLGSGQYLRAIEDGQSSPDRYYSSDMKKDLDEIETRYGSLLVLMNQCFAGGFSDDVLAGSNAKKTFFTAACGADALAYATLPDRDWNRFALNWIRAARQFHIDPVDPAVPGFDKNNSSNLEAYEGFNYCNQLNQQVLGKDTPLSVRQPAPDSSDVSTADDISLV